RKAVPDMTANYARLSFAYLAAMTLKTGSVALQDFTPKSLNDREILDAAAKVNVEINHITDPAEFVPQHVRAELIDGRELKASIDVLFGSPAYPLTHQQHLEKFEKCVAFGLRYINAHQTAMGLIDLVDKLEDLTGCRELFALAAGK
ncbi:MAG TPA: MmgE/PrpD family protein, partial [Hellea balneolensis]|nr:MmgE/PrpD family protein [Hellea balneolensis]